MKKFLIVLTIVFLCGCSVLDVGNTPSKKVEDYFTKYQTLDKSVLADLDQVLINDESISVEDRKKYREFMKNHYKDLTYEIKDETIDGDKATVEVEITVRDYSKTMADVDNYHAEHSEISLGRYRLEELKKVNAKVTYTLYLTLTKIDDSWVLNQLSNEELNKINGLYNG